MSDVAQSAVETSGVAPRSVGPPGDELAYQLWQRWRFGQRPDVFAFVRQHKPISNSQLLAILAIDQQERWAANEPIPVENYFSAFAGLAQEPASGVLIQNEISFRRQLGAAADVEEYRQRLPQLRTLIDTVCGTTANGVCPHNASATAVTNSTVDSQQTVRLAPAWTALRDEDCAGLLPYQGVSATHKETVRVGASIPQLEFVGPYEIQRVLARGGMGVIYQALDTRLKRPVALKMILTGAHADPESFARFRAEAEAVARLQHPSIVQIFEVGEHNGLPFLALEYINGQNLAQRLSGQPLPPREAARMSQTLAEAVEFAHQRGIIHRDLKPANILITAEGQVKITDFGLAKLREARETATRPGEVLGTPNYMAPEQAEGKADLIGPVADVYSLGALLYELLTGQPPFQGGTPLETLLRVRLQEPVTPTYYEPKLPRNLVTICLKCLRKERYQRYASAAELAADLRRFLDDKPVHARPVTAVERAWMWARRHPAFTAVIASSAWLLLLANLLIIWQWREAENARIASQDRYHSLLRVQRDLLQERERVRSVDNERERMEYRQRLRMAELEFLTADTENAIRILNECPIGKRNWEWNYLRRQFEGSAITVQPHGVQLAPTFAPDGQNLISFRDDGTIETRRVATGAVVARQTMQLPPGCSVAGGFAHAVFSGDRQRVAAVGMAPSTNVPTVQILVWSTVDGNPIGACSTRAGAVLRLTLPRDGQRIAWFEGTWNAQSRSYESGKVCLYDLAAQALLWEYPHTRLGPVDLAFCPEGKRLAITGRGQKLLILDAVTGHKTFELVESDWTGRMVAWHPNGQQIALQRNHEIQLVSPAGAKIATLAGHRGLIYQVAYSQDGSRLISASSDDTVRIWDTANCREVQTLVGHTATVDRVAMDDDLRCVASISAAGDLKIWDLANGAEPLALGHDMHKDWVPALALHPNGYWLASGCGDQRVNLWDLRVGKLVRQFVASGPVEALAFDPSGEMLAVGMDQGKLSIWQLETGSKSVLTGHTGAVLAVAFHPNAGLLLSAGEDGRVRIWDVAQGRVIREFAKHTGAIHAMAIHPGGEIVASAGAGGRVRLWRLADLDELQVIAAHPTKVSTVVFGPNGTWFATANSNRERLDAETSIRIWNTNTGQCLRTFAEHKLSIWNLAVSADGHRLASAGEDWTVKVWDADHGELHLTLKGHSDDVRQVLFSRDGRVLLSSGDDACVRVWDATPLAKGPGLRSRWWEQRAAKTGLTNLK